MMNRNGFSRCGEFYIGRLRKEGRHSTAHVYKNALFSFSKFCGTSNVSFRQVTRERLRRYGQYLYEYGLKPNTISTYMRMLRSIYNRGVEAGSAPYVPRLFHDVYTGVDVRQKKALPAAELHKLLYEDPQSERLRRTQAIAALMFQFCGMSFADLAHLEKSALNQNVLRYNRIKTKTPMSVEVLNTAKDMINQLRSKCIKFFCVSRIPDVKGTVCCGNSFSESCEKFREYSLQKNTFFDAQMCSRFFAVSVYK